MGLQIKVDMDTAVGATPSIYLRVESINIHRVFGKITVGITVWDSKESSDENKSSLGKEVKGLVGNKVVYYRHDGDLGTEVSFPTIYQFNVLKPKRVRIPVFEEVVRFEEVPYKDVDEDGNWITCYKTEKVVEREKVGEREDITQVLDLRIEKNLLSWCYGQLKASLGEIFPIEYIEDVEE